MMQKWFDRFFHRLDDWFYRFFDAVDRLAEWIERQLRKIFN